MLGFKITALKILGVIFLMSLICPAPAFAYLDPGTGSMFIQAVIAAFVGIGCTFNIWKKNIIAFFTKNKDKNND